MSGAGLVTPLRDYAAFEREVETRWRTASFADTLRRDRCAVLDFEVEGPAYLTRVGRDQAERDVIDALAAQIALPPGTRTITAMCAHLAETRVADALLALRRAGRSLEAHHTVVFLNGALEATVFDRLARARRAELLAVCARWPECRLDVVTHRFQHREPLGRIRGLLADAVIRRALDAGLPDPILISQDADQLGLAPGYLDTVVRAYAQPLLDATAGLIWWSGYAPPDENLLGGSFLPELLIGDLYVLASDALIRSGFLDGRPNFFTSGPNSSVRLSALCAMGGYDHRLAFKEEVEIGERVKCMRWRGDGRFVAPEHLVFLDKAWVATSPRRAIRCILAGGTLVEQWGDFDEVTGGELLEPQLQAAYRRRAELLKDHDIVRALAGDRRALARFSERAGFILSRSAAYDGFLDRAVVKELARAMGLGLADQAAGDDQAEGLTVDPGASTILHRLAPFCRP